MSSVASGSSVVDSLRTSLSGAADSLLPGRSVTETGGLINVATRNRSVDGDTPGTVDAGTGRPAGNADIGPLARQLAREIGVPALRAALDQDPTLVNLSSDRLSEMLSAAIVDNLQGGDR
jgi:hypothetical protein